MLSSLVSHCREPRGQRQYVTCHGFEGLSYESALKVADASTPGRPVGATRKEDCSVYSQGMIRARADAAGHGHAMMRILRVGGGRPMRSRSMEDVRDWLIARMGEL